ncbi:MAG: 30S ribosomal protein S12 methylthiotransferase RimO [Clostridiales bacterium]|jgi:ribosomal protein S12 methylthiotransferase|nr:30S ribosomal protein S12 methylthiotransferase RimO [Clostridiales bacterium]
MNKFYMVSLGCPKNLVDSEKIVGQMMNSGYLHVEELDLADIIVINTCAFIDDAWQETLDVINEMIEVKGAGVSGKTSDSSKTLCVIGCAVVKHKADLAEMRGIDYIDENMDKFLQDRSDAGGKKVDKSKGVKAKKADASGIGRVTSTPFGMAYLKVAEGCNNHCTFCVIPSIKGKYISRTMEDIIAEAKSLADRNIRELVLVAQDVAYYGMDLYNKFALAELVNKLCEIDGIEWIRLMYCYPEHITDELINVMASQPKVCEYIDIPIQHCSDKVLQAMGRKTNKGQIAQKLVALRDNVQGLSIRTTMMVGFPNEGKEDYAELCEFVKEQTFERLGCFKFSPQEGTPAYAMEQRVSESEKQERYDGLMELQAEVSAHVNVGRISGVEQVMIHKVLDDDALSELAELGAKIKPKKGRRVYASHSRTECYGIDGQVIFEGPEYLNIGDLIVVQITDSIGDYDLLANVLI